MILWIILAIGILAVYFVFKLSHWKYRAVWAILITLFLIFILTFLRVAGLNSVSLSSPLGVFSAFKLYFSWLGQVIGNIKVITGNIVKMNWFSIE